MAQTITIELLQLLEDKLGKEEGRKVASAIEVGLEVIEKKADAVALQKKLELLTRQQYIAIYRNMSSPLVGDLSLFSEGFR